MLSEEQWELAQKILGSVLDEADKLPYDELPFKILRPKSLSPEMARLIRLIPEDPYLFYEPCPEIAGLEVKFYTHYFAPEMFSRCKDALAKFLANTTATDRDERSVKLGSVVSAELNSLLLEKLTDYAITRFIYSLEEKIENAVEELANEAILVALAGFIHEVGGEFTALNIKDYHTGFIFEEYQRILAETHAERRSSLKESLKYLLLPNFEELQEYYREVLPLWQDAKSLYKQNRNRPTWRDIIKAAHPDLKDEDDLISRLSGRLQDLPEEIQAKLSEKGGDSKPSSIALEHAARLCGANPYEYSVRYLYYNLRKCENGEQDEGGKYQQDDNSTVNF